MGLLDDLLAGIGGQQNAERVDPRQQQGGGGGMATVMQALLPLVLTMLANRGGSQASAAPRGGGGLQDILGSLLGGQGGEAGGGLGDLLSQLQRSGFGAQADSWVGRGPNQPISPEAMDQVFGRDGMAEIARRAGVSENDARRGLSQLLPEVVDRVTPDGQQPDFDQLVASVDALSRRMR